ncbi:hypothetical protein [Mycobacterium sp. IS-3022]|uniref:hypothetical protein n=1 Tax=Mycobacterium sp. IS-3022 TaxID=1772277 RepID=UPI0007414FFF|nr:hypothetical protein [Mycobacterium sp. IS-3022]KUI02647.1 hypothetical protein AU188_14665 [Mycobacterium sp. IS-3022]
MVKRTAIGAVMGIAVVAIAATGCGTTEGDPKADEPDAATSEATTSATATTSETVAATPAGPPVGTATMEVRGGAGPVSIRYRINGGPEQTETNVTLPWQKQYPVYNEVQSSVTADGGDTSLICSITMDGNLLAFKSEPRPTCSFSYWG